MHLFFLLDYLQKLLESVGYIVQIEQNVFSLDDFNNFQKLDVKIIKGHRSIKDIFELEQFYHKKIELIHNLPKPIPKYLKNQ